MKTVLKGLTMAALVAAVASPAEAQTKSWGFGIHGGWVNTGKLAHGDVQDRHLKLDNGWSVGSDLEAWFGSRRWGLRAEGTYMKQPFILDREPDAANPTNPDIDPDEEQEVLQGYSGVHQIFADANFMLRLLPTTVDRRFAPFISLGAGLMHWNYDRAGEEPGEFEAADAWIANDSDTEIAVTGSGGFDLFFTPSVALRLEAKDYWLPESPLQHLSELENDHKGGHNWQYRAGLVFNFGGARVAEPGFVAAPPPPPAPAPAPAPAPPATERVSMCVVDSSGRLQMVDATRYIETGQIYVTRNGQEVAFSTVYPVVEPSYIRSAPWYVASRPLVLDLDDNDMGGDLDDEIDDAIEQTDNLPANRVEFVNFGARGPMVMGDVMYVGSIDGTPLYAKISDVGTLRADLTDRLRTTTNLDDILDDTEFADRFVNEIETFYLAVEPSANDCVFQPVSSTRVVRRTNG